MLCLIIGIIIGLLICLLIHTFYMKMKNNNPYFLEHTIFVDENDVCYTYVREYIDNK